MNSSIANHSLRRLHPFVKPNPTVNGTSGEKTRWQHPQRSSMVYTLTAVSCEMYFPEVHAPDASLIAAFVSSNCIPNLRA